MDTAVRRYSLLRTFCEFGTPQAVDVVSRHDSKNRCGVIAEGRSTVPWCKFHHRLVENEKPQNEGHDPNIWSIEGCTTLPACMSAWQSLSKKQKNEKHIPLRFGGGLAFRLGTARI